MPQPLCAQYRSSQLNSHQCFALLLHVPARSPHQRDVLNVLWGLLPLLVRSTYANQKCSLWFASYSFGPILACRIVRAEGVGRQGIQIRGLEAAPDARSLKATRLSQRRCASLEVADVMQTYLASVGRRSCSSLS